MFRSAYLVLTTIGIHTGETDQCTSTLGLAMRLHVSDGRACSESNALLTASSLIIASVIAMFQETISDY